MKSRTRTKLIGAAVLLAALTAASAPTVSAKKPPKEPVSVQILALNDFHGQLEPASPLSSSGRLGSLDGTFPNQFCGPRCLPAGGAEYLATHVEALRATNPNTVFASAGDLIGATPLLSALFHDEPTIEAFNLMGLDYNGVGNHEFDEGVDELLRMQHGDTAADGYVPARPDGCHPVDDCGDDDGFGGADFDFLAANVVYNEGGDTIFPPYAIHDFPGGVKVAFVGMTLEGTPLIVSPDGISSVSFLDEADSVNALVPHLIRQGIKAIVVLLHEGGSVDASGNGSGGTNGDLINNCTTPTGPIVDVVERMHDQIDIVITGHTNWAVNCNIAGKVVTGAAAQGRLVTDIDATINPRNNDFASITVNNRKVTQDVPKSPAMTSLIAEYNVFVTPVAGVRVGATAAPLNGTATVPGGGDSNMGRLIADAQLASSVAAGAGGQIAFMNPGGIRASLDAGDITYGEAFAVQPFSNIVTTKTFTGAQIDAILEQQFVTSAGGTRSLILQVSEGFTYSFSASAPAGSKVDPLSITLGGTVIDPNGTYRVTMNNFLGGGGDDFPAFKLGTNETTGADDLVALIDYLKIEDPYTPTTTSRITRLN